MQATAYSYWYDNWYGYKLLRVFQNKAWSDSNLRGSGIQTTKCRGWPNIKLHDAGGQIVAWLTNCEVFGPNIDLQGIGGPIFTCMAPNYELQSVWPGRIVTCMVPCRPILTCYKLQCGQPDQIVICMAPCLLGLANYRSAWLNHESQCVCLHLSPTFQTRAAGLCSCASPTVATNPLFSEKCPGGTLHDGFVSVEIRA